MPEGHTLHRLARRFTEDFGGRRVAVSTPQGRFPDAALVDGQVYDSGEAVGKHLFHHFGSGAIVHVHLGLYGGVTRLEVAGDPPDPVGQVRMRMVGGPGDGPRVVADLRGPTRCELLDDAGREAILARLGPDPLDPDADPMRVVEATRRSRRPLGALLMDQKVISGVGNVYRAEVLFRQRVDPFRPGRDVAPATILALWDDLVRLMPIGVERGAIVTVEPEHDHGDLPRRGADKPRNYVYQRDGCDCRVCCGHVRVTSLDHRSIYWCPTCQVG